ncbi:serine hydrolase [Spirosoma gilvum]
MSPLRNLYTLILFVYSLNAFGQTKAHKLDELMQAYLNVNEFNGSVLVSRQGKILLKKGYGFRDRKLNATNEPQTIFQIASITKTLTATLVLKLVELKKLTLQDKLSQFYPHYPHGDSISVQDLLAHTAGIYNYTQDREFMLQQASKPATEAKMLALFQNKPLDFSPGTDWNYSNSGYSLLGYIIQKVTQMSYQQALSQYVLKPLEMTQSGFDFSQVNPHKRATGYYAQTGKEYTQQAPIVDSSVSFSAGSLYSTVEDLYRFHQGLQRHQIIGANLQEEAYRPIRHQYGLGWMIDTVYGQRVVSHSGGIFGFRSNFARLPADDVCIILLANIETPALAELTKGLLAVLYEQPYELPVQKRSITLPESILMSYIGTYELSEPHLVIQVNVEDGQLIAYPANGPRSVLVAEDENHFFDQLQESIRIWFEKDSSGRVDRMLIKMNGNTRIGKRKSD